MHHVIREQTNTSGAPSDVREKATKQIERGLSGWIQRLKTRYARANFRMAGTKAGCVAWGVYFWHYSHSASASILNNVLNIFSAES
jgi:hypothetical protein